MHIHAATGKLCVIYMLLVKVLRASQHKIDYFKNVPQANLLAWYVKTKPNTTKAHIHQEMHYITK